MMRLILSLIDKHLVSPESRRLFMFFRVTFCAFDYVVDQVSDRSPMADNKSRSVSCFSVEHFRGQAAYQTTVNRILEKDLHLSLGEAQALSNTHSLLSERRGNFCNFLFYVGE